MSPIDIAPMAPSATEEHYRDTVLTPNGIGFQNGGYTSGPTQHTGDSTGKPLSYFNKPVCFLKNHITMHSYYPF